MNLPPLTDPFATTGPTDPKPEYIAFSGEVELLNAKWDLDSGRTVEFRITGEFATMRHPFKDFTRKRGGRVGSRFHAVCARSEVGEINYDGEMMLADWQEKPGSGMTVRFWLDDDASHHPFAGCSRRKGNIPGEMFALTLVELTDDQQAEAQPHERKKRGLSQDAHFMVTSPMFVQYLTEMKSHLQKSWDANKARAYVKSVLAVESLGELDHNPEKIRLFHEQIRKPYALWNGEH